MLMRVLTNQVAMATRARFKIADDPSTVQKMLAECYRAEVARRFKTYCADNATAERIAKVAKWLTGDYKPGLLMYGQTCGTGKSTMARAICNLIGFLFDSPYGQERKRVHMVSAIDLVKFYTENPDRYANAKNSELLFIDDLGTELSNVKVYGNEFSPVTELLYTRYDRLRWTIVTSNLTDEQIREKYGDRIDDRMREMFERLHFQGRSYRL